MRNNIFRSQCLHIAAALLAAALPAAGQRQADLSRLVVIGDSLSAGYQNGSLHEAQQPHGYASLIASQKGAALPLPLMAAPGIPNVLVLKTPGPPMVIEAAPGMSPGRVDPTVQPMNLAVPGARVHDALFTRPDFNFADFADLVLGLPGAFGGVSKTQVEWAEALNPTTVLIWIGSNDALGAMLVADPSDLTPVDSFAADYHALAGRLAATGAALAMANIPDVTVVPYLTPAEDVAAAAGAPLAAVGPMLGLEPGAFVTPDALPLIQAILLGSAAGPLPGNVVLTPGEVAAIRAAIRAYNGVIAAEAQARGAALVDINALTYRLQLHGFVAGGQRLTTEFLGGLFSLDGIHPSNTGYALFANEFINALNTQFAAGIPPVIVEQVKAADPLAFPWIGHPASALGSIGPEAVKSLRRTMAR